LSAKVKQNRCSWLTYPRYARAFFFTAFFLPADFLEADFFAEDFADDFEAAVFFLAAMKGA